MEVPEDETPSNGLLPKTGEESRTPIYMLGMAVIALGAGLLRRAARQ
ncbi:LPXTG cell wall anchor domain-containing protein [Saccharibacillus sp. O23]